MAKAMQFEVYFQDELLGTVSVSRTGRLRASDESVRALVESVAETNGLTPVATVRRLGELLPAGHRTWARRA